jgi:hypothetical protein
MQAIPPRFLTADETLPLVLRSNGTPTEAHRAARSLRWAPQIQESAMPQLAATPTPRLVPERMSHLLTVPGPSECAQHPRYWPSDLLYSFTLQMAARGFCVSASMMLGDREYALEQLAQAHTLNDEALRLLAVKLFTYFDEPSHPAVGSAARLN